MNWEAIGAMGEIIGAGAVVLSLMYLAVQVRTQNKDSRAAAMHEISLGFRDSIATMTTPENAELWIRANEAYETLSDVELVQLIGGLQRMLRVWEEAFHQHRANRLDNYIWEVMVLQYRSFLGAPALSRVWSLRQEYFHEDFRDFVNGLVATSYEIR